jgi:hypothetical protein
VVPRTYTLSSRTSRNLRKDFMNTNDACYGRGKLRNKMELKSLAAMLCCARDKCRGKLMLCSLLVQMFIVSADVRC